MKESLLLILLVFLFKQSFGQIEAIKIKTYNFVIKTEVAKNEWNSTDTICKFFRVENKDTVYVLKFFRFEDWGSDCNNSFWINEHFEIQGDSILFITTYLQKTGMDPIPTHRKQIFKVNNEGKLNLIYDRYKYDYSDEWLVE